jgi:ribose 5-phosphate isomerase B
MNSRHIRHSAREHNNANILTLGARVVGAGLAQNIVKIWLETPFGGGRHERRVNKISEIEKRVCKTM